MQKNLAPLCQCVFCLWFFLLVLVFVALLTSPLATPCKFEPRKPLMSLLTTLAATPCKFCHTKHRRSPSITFVLFGSTLRTSRLSPAPQTVVRPLKLGPPNNCTKQQHQAKDTVQEARKDYSFLTPCLTPGTENFDSSLHWIISNQRNELKNEFHGDYGRFRTYKVFQKNLRLNLYNLG